MLVLAINPGSTSTKVAVVQGDQMTRAELSWKGRQLSLERQVQPRLQQVLHWLQIQGVAVQDLQGVVARGGLLRPLVSGTYLVDEIMVQDAVAGRRGRHPANLGPILAYQIYQQYGPAPFVVDPVSVDEMEPIAKVSGAVGIERTSFAHVLNIKAASRQAAASLGRDVRDTCFTAAHLGGGISIAALKGGRLIDVANPADEGPFSAERAGTLPSAGVLRLWDQYGHQKAVAITFKESGLSGYLSTVDLQKVESGGAQEQLVFLALVYQIAGEIGAYISALKGRIDGVIITGGMARSGGLLQGIRDRLPFVKEWFIYPGEQEMEALMAGALRVLSGKEKAKRYGAGGEQ